MCGEVRHLLWVKLAHSRTQPIFPNSKEYYAAQQFLDNLPQDFPLDRKQMVLVPR
ncbi:MAG: hypothetical protein F6J99_43140, partial [Moorea sp. SIO4G3]|nr:hypothetical protein [Moorena sp. SIO4G3]